MAGLLIGELGKRTGVAAATVRYYEAVGLLKPPARSASGYRHYSEDTVQELNFIRKAQVLGFSLEEIAEILRLTRSGQAPCERVLSLAQEHLAALDERIRQLQEFRRDLGATVGKWNGATPPSCEGLCQIISMAPPGIGRPTTVSRAFGKRRARSSPTTR